MTNLTRSQIVGQTIVDLLQSKWSHDDDGFASCEVYVRLSNNVLFELGCQDPFEEIPIPIVNLDYAETLEPVPNDISELAVGTTVLEVLTSKLWPTFGLLLSNGNFLFCSDDLYPREVGPCVLPVGEWYELNDVATYWGHQQLQM